MIFITYRIPTGKCLGKTGSIQHESQRHMNTYREAIRVAAWIAPNRDVGEHFGIRIDEGVQESERGLACRKKLSIEQCNGTGEDGR